MGWPELLATADRVTLTLLGAPVTYTPSVGAPAAVRGIFDAAYVHVDAGHGGVSSVGPAVFLLLSDLPSDPEDDAATVTVGGTVYQLREVKKDGQGGVLLLLHGI